MGVTGLWTVVQGCARPTKLETLNKKRLAVDASIWIYQFLKAVRDKEGKALRNSHVVGFFRRICKLLFFGIKPVFVFDGGAPILKRQTISSRRARREGRREDAVRTASKLLAVQMQRRAEEEAEKAKARAQNVEEEEVPDDLVYVNELGMTAEEKKRSRGFKKKDQYHLPDLDVDIATLGAPNDPRIMSQEELEEYARQFHSGEEINLYDFSKIDFESPFFVSLPASDRYNILNAARLKSRLRMGYGKEQLETMFPDRMAFSKFQIERVKERNELTQRLMNLNGMNGQEFNINARVAGEKGKEYVLVKNDGVEGGWALGVVSNKDGGEREKPIDVDSLGMQIKRDDESEDEDDFHDVPIEGLNRLPKHPALKTGLSSADDLERRKNLYLQRRQRARHPVRTPSPEEPAEEGLFVNGEGQNEENDEDAEFEDVLPQDSENEELQRAIAMSLEKETVADERPNWEADMLNGPAIDQPLQYNKKNAKAGRAYAHIANERANREIPAAPFAEDSDEENGPLVFSTPRKSKPALRQEYKVLDHGFGGPLPFESLNLGKATPVVEISKEDGAGGFEKEEENQPAPLPPWFSAQLEDGYAAMSAQQKTDLQQYEDDQFRPRDGPILHRHPTKEVIDLDEAPPKRNEIIDIDAESDQSEVEMIDMMPETESFLPDDKICASQDGNHEPVAYNEDEDISMNDLAEEIRVAPPESLLPVESGTIHTASQEEQDEDVDWSESDAEAEKIPSKSATSATGATLDTEASEPTALAPFAEDSESGEDEFEDVAIPSSLGVNSGAIREAVEADVDDERPTQAAPAANMITSEDQEIQNAPSPEQKPSSPTLTSALPSLPQEYTTDSRFEDQDFDEFSDPEDAELLQSLAEETEEHARFAASLADTARTTTKEDYERELKQLRNQQKRDLRDSDEVTQIMITECQQLLKLFGLPYITAPMEAEAQCAELVSLGLVDGIVTDDSDVFLFGGTRVYKNMFNQAKYVECYLASDLEKEHSLTREKVIQAAHLLGSDYTEGLPHVGPVTAMEILSEFPSLTDFRNWWEKVQTGQKIPGDEKNSFRRKFKKNASKVFLPIGFPDPRVDQAYLHPEVDSDPSPFAWGVPDLDALRSYLMATIGWGRERADEILVPVIRDMNRREVEGTQANITRFFSGSVGTGTVIERNNDSFAPRKKKQTSSRMESALTRIHKKAQQRLAGVEPEEEDEPQPAQPQKTRRKKRVAVRDDNDDEEESEEAPPRKATKRTAREAH